MWNNSHASASLRLCLTRAKGVRRVGRKALRAGATGRSRRGRVAGAAKLGVWGADMGERLDADGYRPNVGIVVANEQGQVLWARRVGGRDAWQFPQGGIQDAESPREALFRELQEEVGLNRDQVEILGVTRGWLRYRLPARMRRSHFQGQKQKWFLLRLLCADGEVSVASCAKPEFDDWRWVSYWYPLGKVVAFKRGVYRRALKELAPALVIDERA